MATNFLKVCRTGSAIDVAFPVGAPGVGCAAGRIHIESLGGKGKLCSWWSSTAPFPLPSLLNKGRNSSFFSHGYTTTQIPKDSDDPCY